MGNITAERILARQQVQAAEKKFYEERQTLLFSDGDVLGRTSEESLDTVHRSVEGCGRDY